MKRIYLDYAAGSPIRPEVIESMAPYFGAANPSALYREADAAREALELSREKIAHLMGVKTREIIFVSSSTEANNLAIFGVARASSRSGRHPMSATKPEHIVTTQIEHPSILEPLGTLEREGWKVTRVGVNKEGFINADELRAALPNNARLITFAWANPDIGVIQPIRELTRDIGSETIVHLDASQALYMLDLNIPSLGADLVTISSSKIGGPRGIAALVVRAGIKLEPLIYGGGQERNLRAGTENVASAVGFASALELACEEQEREGTRLSELRDLLLKKIPKEIPDVLVTGPSLETIKKGRHSVRLPNHASFAFKNIEGEELIIRLDQAGFAVGTGSACDTLKEDVSVAIKALDLPPDYEKGTLRVTPGKQNTLKEIIDFIAALKDTVAKMRAG